MANCRGGFPESDAHCPAAMRKATNSNPENEAPQRLRRAPRLNARPVTRMRVGDRVVGLVGVR
jgi:hypothetical protein